MGSVASSLPLTRYIHPETLASVSPWQTSVSVDNQTDGPILMLLAASSEDPHPADCVRHVLPGKDESGITSGWYHEPRATLLIRTGLEEAKVLRAPTGSRIIVRLKDHGKGLELDVPRSVEVEDFKAAAANVPGLDTTAMCFRGISFDDVLPKSDANIAAVLCGQDAAQAEAEVVGAASEP
eukprot:TRINITY_DN1603_c0_g2_i1.p2 TRINITY_DN1603_c0_g2~~TRINITY_DN1603_c0_g2_i1.p2  ORF type:complete len:181 (+),score=34.88 TRINITY_DN1603_c0_g2_i1:86-628(+)